MRILHKRETKEYISHILFSKVAICTILLCFIAFTSFGQNLIYSCDFEDDAENANWILIDNGDEINSWYIGTGANNGGNNGLYISYDGESNTYNNEESSYVYAYRSIQIDESAIYQIKFDWRAVGLIFYGYKLDLLRAFLIPDTLSPVLSGGNNNGMLDLYNSIFNATPDGWIEVSENGEPLLGESEWQTSRKEMYIEPGEYILVFYWQNVSEDDINHESGNNPPAAIDNISIMKATCPMVANISVLGITTESATINWTELGSAESWEIIVSETEFNDEELAAAVPVATTSPSYSATGLTTITNYYVYVRAVCSTDDKSDWKTATFTTKACPLENSCEIIYALYDGYGDGWTGNAINVVDEESGIVIASLTLENGDSEIGYLEVCDGREIRFEYVSGEYSDEISYDIFDANREVLFSGSGAMSSSVTHIVSCPTCKMVTNLRATEITTESATISWSDYGTAQTWNIIVSTREQEQEELNVSGNIITVTDSTYSLTGLNLNTIYYIYVRGFCSDDDQSAWKPIIFRTEQTPITLPYTCDFEDENENVNWTLNNGNQTNKWYIGTAAYNGGETGLYISNDGGTNNSYNISSISYVYCFRKINLDNNGLYSIDFDWHANGESGYDLLRAFIIPTTLNPNLSAGASNNMSGSYNNTPSGWMDAGNVSTLNGHSDWQHSYAEITLEAGSYYLVFFWKNDGSVGSMPPAAIDNIHIEQIINPIVVTSPASNIGANYATLNGYIHNQGASDVTGRGFEYGTDPENLTENITSTDENNEFSAEITGLDTNTFYYYRAYATNSDGTGYGEIKSLKTHGLLNGYTYADLGLPSNTYWATANIGATNPEDFGNYYAWGEIEPKDAYDWSTYQHCNGSANSLTKYCSDPGYGDNGFTDDLTTLEASDDVANVNMGSFWRMPTHEEMEELYNNCNSTWTSINGVNGRLFTSRINGNSIFMPAAGTYGENGLRDVGSYGTFWPSSLKPDIPTNTWRFLFYSGNCLIDNNSRYEGQSIRAVYRPSPTVAANFTTDITLTSATLHGRILNIGSSEIIERGFVYGTSRSNLTDTVQSEDRTNEFSYGITGLTNGTTYYYRAYATNSDYTSYSEIKSFSTLNGQLGDHYYVNLGLPSGTMWASTNIGATTTEELGTEYAWGETTSKDNYEWDNYNYCNGAYNSLTKYCNNSEYGNGGFTDSLTTLEANDDAAVVNWGEEWIMPSQADIQELIDNCNTTWITINGIRGMLVTSNSNGNSIFLPADYDDGLSKTAKFWSSSLYTDNPSTASYMYVYSGDSESDPSFSVGNESRFIPMHIRPVYKVELTAMDIDYEPYICDFEDSEENANWILSNGRQTNKWHIGTAVNNGGEKSLYISNDGGENYTYNTGATSYVYAYRKINITDTDKYQFDFDRRIRGEGNWDLLRAFLVPDSIHPNLSGGTDNGMSETNNITPTGWIDISTAGVMSEQMGWKHNKTKLNINSGVYYLTFFWKNDGSGGYSPPAAVDNVMVRKLPPFEVTTLTAPHTSTTATLGAEIVIDRETEITQVGFAYGESENQLLDTLRMAYSENTFTSQLTGLTPQTNYYYRAFAKYDDRTVFGDIVTFRTKSNDTDGTIDNPLTIDNAEEWALFAEAMQQSENQSISTYKGFEIYNCGDDTYFKLTADIDLAYCNNTVVDKFSGHLNGNGNTITIRFNEQIGAPTAFNTIENATIDSLNILVPVSYEIEANVASYGALCLSAKSSVISNCSTLVATQNKKITSPNSGKFGGFVGNSINNTIVNCTNNLTIEVSADSYAWVGGIVGSMEGGLVSGCTNNAVIKGVYAGGITGQILEATLPSNINVNMLHRNSLRDGQMLDAALISNLNAGKVTAQEMAGGIIASIGDGNVLVDKCMNIAEIFATNQGCDFVSIGGIVGYNPLAALTISNCANYGSFPALSMQIGGMFGNGIAYLNNNVSVSQFSGVSDNGNYYTYVYATSGTTDENNPNVTDFFDRQVCDMRNEYYRLMYASRGTGLETTEVVGSALESSLAANWSYTDGLYPMPVGVPEDNRTTAARIPLYFQPDNAAAAVMDDFTLPTSISGHDVTWLSSNTNIISISGETATVNRPRLGESDVEVTLTATYEGITKTFVLLVISPKLVPVNTNDANLDAAPDVVLNGSYSYQTQYLSYVKECGFVYSTKPNFSDSTNVVVDANLYKSRNFSFTDNNFEPGRSYYYMAFSSTADTTLYGEVKRFRTAGPPEVTIRRPLYRGTDYMEILVDVEYDDEVEPEMYLYGGTDRDNLTMETVINRESDYHYYYAYFDSLQPETRYWFVAEATDSFGTRLSDTVAFYTYGTFIDDRDNTEYKSIIIGNQKWMVENLRYAGNVPLVTSEIPTGFTESETEPYRYYPNNSRNNVEGYGYIYNWSAAIYGENSSVMNPSGVQGICPNGWHLPSDAEWQELNNELGSGLFDDAGAQMAGEDYLWSSGKLTDSYYFSTSGFNALPAGGFYGDFRHFGEEASFWTTTETNLSTIDGMVNAVANYDIVYSSTSLDVAFALKQVGNSVRCIRGTTIYAAFDTITLCGDDYTYYDTTFTESGDYVRRFFYEEYADSAYSLHLTLNHPPRVELEQTACEVFEWNGQTYTELGDYVQTFVDVNGCDSTVTVHLIDLDDCYGIVSGIITDAGTGTAIPNARVTIGTEFTRTNTEGEYSLSVPRGNWVMKVLATGYASYNEMIDIQTDTVLNIELVMPQITTNVNDISATTYPYLAHNDSITISNVSQTPLIWSSVTDYDNLELLPEQEDFHRSRNSRALWDSIQTFTTQFNAEQAITTDGFFIYTSSWQRPGEFNRYTPDGEYIETFYIENVGMIRNLSYDGRYFYGTETTNIIFKLDLDNQMLVDSITTDISNIRHCSFDRQNGNLLAGDWNSLFTIDTATGVSTQIRDDLMNVYSSAYDNLSPDGPYLWLFSQTSEDNGPSACIRQFSISSGEYTDKTHYLDDIELGDASLAGGICASEQIMDGKFVLLADVQNPLGNNTIATYEIGQTNSVVISDRKSGELLPNESVTINMQEYTTNVGDFNATIRYRIAVVGNQSSDLNVSVSSIAPECEAVQQLTAVTNAANSVTLEWQPTEQGDYNSVSYLVFCDNSRFAIDTTTENTITIAGLSAGEHCFNVRTMYVDEYTCMSSASETVCADIYDPSCDVYIMVETESDGDAIYVEWNKPAGVEYFRITRDDNAVDEVLYDNIYIDLDVAPETNYCYTITGYLENDLCNEISSTTCMRIVPGICAESPVLKVEAIGSSVALNWTGTSDAFSYKVYRNGMPIGLTTETSYYDKVDSASYYCYWVKSVCEYRMVALSNEECLFVDDIAEWTENNLSVYPNPTSGQFFIEGSQIATVRIYNTVGQIVDEIENNESEHIEIHCDGWNSGLYNVQIISIEGKVATRRVTIFR
ncbi:MAG: carboxypeptidase regulatory-like domain-containing protein [Bacteroidales bacterium]|nr:carboxypeptidase regulatory-like domain-containing protein [Bacteroidales bacterium]